MVSPRYLKPLTSSTGCPLMNVQLSVGGVLDVCTTISFDEVLLIYIFTDLKEESSPSEVTLFTSLRDKSTLVPQGLAATFLV